MNTFDLTIANVALPYIQGSVSASQDRGVRVLTAPAEAAQGKAASPEREFRPD